MAVNWPGTAYTRTDLTDGAGNDYPQAAHINEPANEVVAMQPHFGAGSDVTTNGGIRLLLKDSGTVIAHTGQRAIDDLAGTPQEVLPDDTYDVAVGAVVAYMVKPSSGSANGGILTIYNGDTEYIYDDGTNQVTLTINAAGDAVVTRAAGTLTYDIGLNFLIIM
jgi:hypothetical protein